MVTAMNASAIRSDWVGRVIDGRFALLQWLGGSPRTGVFLTEMADPPRKAALKLIAADPEQAEARIAAWAASAHLSHPNLIGVIQTGRCQVDDTDLIYVLTEDADEILSEVLPDRPLTPDETAELLNPVLDTLAWLHGKGFVHGHLKPSNLLVVKDELKLSSDGLQRAGQAGNQTGGIYAAPESSTGALTPAADLWALGITVVEALTQRPPQWTRAGDGAPVVPESVPEPYAAIAKGCLEPDPARRFTLADVRAALDSVRPSAAASAENGRKLPAKLHLGVLVAVLVVLAVVVGVVRWRSHPPEAAQGVEEQQQTPAAVPAAPPQVQEQKPSAGTSMPQRQETAPAASETQEQPPSEAQPEQPASADTASSPPASAPAAEATTASASTVNSQGVEGQALGDQVLSRVMPNVLPAATQSIHGRFNVRIRVAVDAAGNVTNATYDSEGPSPYFAGKALQAAQGWKFKPAEQGGQSAPRAWILQFQFTQDGAQATPIKAAP